jgi:hypothetical protein
MQVLLTFELYCANLEISNQVFSLLGLDKMWQLTVVTFCCIIGAKLGGGYLLFIDGAKEFFAFNPKAIQDTSLITCIKVLPIGILLSLISSILCANILRFFGIYNNMENTVKPTFVQGLKDDSLINFICFILFFEEGIFRFIPIVISYFFNTNLAILLLIFNIAFALVHLGNFDTKNPLITLPQFCSGLVISICAYKFGFVTAAIIHLYFDFVLFSTYRKIRYGLITFFIAIYYAIIGILGLGLCSSVLPEIGTILTWNSPIPRDIELNYQQAIGIIMFTFGLVKSFGNLAGFDNVSSPINKKYNIEQLIGLAIVGSLVNILFSFFSSWLLLNTFANYHTIASLLFALVFVGFYKQSSLSGGAFHAFKIPVSALSLLIYAIVGPIMTIQLAFSELLIALPDILILVNSEEI